MDGVSPLEACLERRGKQIGKPEAGAAADGRRRGCGPSTAAQHTSRRSPEHPVYPYLRGMSRITRPNQSLPPRGGGMGRRPLCHLPAHGQRFPLLGGSHWTGTAGACCPGSAVQPLCEWHPPAFAPRRWRRPWVSRASRRCATPTRPAPAKAGGRPVHPQPPGVHRTVLQEPGEDQSGREGAVPRRQYRSWSGCGGQ